MFVSILTDVFNHSLDQSEAFDRRDHRFLATILEIARFEPEFCKWISML